MDSLIQSHSPLARIWLISDLQQRIPDMAEGCLNIALEDVQALDVSPTAIWYLGDAVEGMNKKRVDQMIRMQIKKLSDLNIPLRFVMGNHDMDLTVRQEAGKEPLLPVWEAFRQVPNWKTTPSPSDFYFTDTYGDVLVVFISDHADLDNRWIATQQTIDGADPDAYDVPDKAFRELRAHIASWKGPVVIASHYPLPGGARAKPCGGLLTRLLPLPDTVKLVFHGHAHIGDWRIAKENACQKITWIDWHTIPQINISSLDRSRGSQTRSAFLDMYEDGTFGVFFRDHEDRRWSEVFFVDASYPRSISSVSRHHHETSKSFENTPLESWQSQHAAGYSV